MTKQPTIPGFWKKILPILGILSIMMGFYNCGNLEKEITLELPGYESQLVVECYLEPGQPFSLVLTKSAAYFDPLPTNEFDFVQSILVDSADVTISFNGEVIHLKNEIFLNNTTKKVYNYFSARPVPYDTIHEFNLEIITRDGQEIYGKTKILPIIPIDSVVVEFNEKADSLARILTYVTENPVQDNYYRRMLHVGSLDTIPDQDFTTNDDFVDDGILVFGSGYDFKEGDVVYNSIFHIDREYYDFLESIFYAIDANGNPFGQPAVIHSNLQGDAIGIFTGVSIDRKYTVIHK